MGSVSDGLLQALLALSPAEKESVFTQLLEDQDFKLTVVNYFMKSIDGMTKNSTNIKRRMPERMENLGLRINGSQIRDRYIAELKDRGIIINRTSTTWGKTEKGVWIGMPLGDERVPNKWFLGLGEEEVMEKSKDGGVTIAVLCYSADEGILDFILPQSVILKLLPKMSKSKGQIKFNIKRSGLKYYMNLPGALPLDLTDYRNNVHILKS